MRPVKKAPLCLCNGIPRDAFEEAIKDHRNDLPNDPGILEATGRIYQCARDKTTATPDKNPCASCFDVVAKRIKAETGLFTEEKLPERGYDGNCPRRQQAKAAAPACCQ